MFFFVYFEGWYDIVMFILFCIEGIGWLWVELLFLFGVVDCMVVVFDVVLIVVVWYVSVVLGC